MVGMMGTLTVEKLVVLAATMVGLMDWTMAVLRTQVTAILLVALMGTLLAGTMA